MAHIIVVGNEKGGSGKSTVSMHMDLDLRQLTFGRYVENRRHWCGRNALALPGPLFLPLPELDPPLAEGNPHDARMTAALERLEPDCDFILIDCPGAHTRLSQYAHSVADTLITPINDSFVDFDLLARTDAETGKVLSPSIYSDGWFCATAWAPRPCTTSARWATRSRNCADESASGWHRASASA